VGVSVRRAESVRGICNTEGTSWNFPEFSVSKTSGSYLKWTRQDFYITFSHIFHVWYHTLSQLHRSIYTLASNRLAQAPPLPFWMAPALSGCLHPAEDMPQCQLHHGMYTVCTNNTTYSAHWTYCGGLLRVSDGDNLRTMTLLAAGADA